MSHWGGLLLGWVIVVENTTVRMRRKNGPEIFIEDHPRRLHIGAFAARLKNFVKLLANDYNCTGTLGSITVDNLNVPQNATGTLKMDPQVEGNLASSTPLCMPTPRSGRQYPGLFRSARVEVHPDFSWSAGIFRLIPADRRRYPGCTSICNLQAFRNTGGVSITGNTIDNNLQCVNNDPPPTGGDNNVGGDMEDQCANLQLGNPPPAVNRPGTFNRTMDCASPGWRAA